MYYYAVLNTKDIVEYISEQETEVTYYEYISIPTSDQSLVGKWYDREGVYGTVGAFLEVPISIQAEHSSSQINYKGQDVWLDEKLDSYATQSDLSSGLSGKANLNHFHDTATQTSGGYMSSGDKAKLDGIEANANLYVHPDTHAASMITGLSDVAQSGSYNDLTDRPTIPTIPTALPADGGNADTLDGYHAAYFASGQHNHDAVYAPANHTHDYAATYHTHEKATTSEAGFMSAEDKTKLNGIASGANSYTHPASHPASMITETDSLKVMTAAERTKLSGIAENANNYTHPETHSAAIIEETSLKKVMTAEERTKLAGIESGANKYSHPSTHPATMITGLSDVATSGSYDDLSDKPTSMTPTAHTHAQSEITGLETALSGKSNTNHTHAAASTSVAGFMSKEDKTKLNGIAANANAYTHPSTHAASMITGLSDVATSGSYNDLSNKPTIPAAYTHPSTHPASMITGLSDVATSGSYNDLSDTPTSMTPKAHTHAQSDITGLATALSGKSDTSHSHSNATTTAAGFMSKDDKSKLDGIATGANKTTVDTALSSTSTNPVQNKVVNTALSGKADTSHTHTQSQVTGLETALAGKAASSHSHAQSDITGLATALNGKAASSHTHAQSDITGLETALSGKASTNHTEHNGEIIANKVSGAGITLQSSYGKTRIHKNSSASSDYGTIISDYDTDGKRDYLQLRRSAPSAERKLFLMSESAEDGTVSQYKIYGEHNKPGILWSGVVYPGATSVVTFSKTLSECRGGILLLWSDYDPDTSTASNNDFVTTIIPRMSPTGDNWNGESFYCDIPRYIGSDTNDVTTESRIIKRVKVYNNKLEGYAENAKSVRTDVVLRAVFEY